MMKNLIDEIRDTRYEIRVLDLGLKDYQEVWALQSRLVKKRISGEIKDILILVEHFPVITLGRRGKKEEVLVPPEYLSRKKITVFRVDRGGKVTFHGPGQLVVYPILNLTLDKKDIHWYIRSLEEAIIKSLARLGVRGECKKGYTGVWIGEKKIASIGIGVKRWVTYHGLALNVTTDLSYFSLINSCGLQEKKVTSLTEVLSSKVKMDRVKTLFVNSFCEVFKRTPKLMTDFEKQ